MSDGHTVRVDGGKFTFIKRANELTVEIRRHGQRWHEQRDAFNALVSMMAELDAARVVLAAVRSLVKRGGAPPELYNALSLHGALVDDQEHPSEWAVPS